MPHISTARANGQFFLPNTCRVLRKTGSKDRRNSPVCLNFHASSRTAFTPDTPAYHTGHLSYSSLSFVTPNPLISLHTEQSACLFIRPAVSPHTLLHMIRRHSASHHFLPLRIPLYFPRTRYRILREKRKKDALSVILLPEARRIRPSSRKQTQPYPPSCKQTKRLGELTKKQTAKRKAIHKEAQEQSAA